MLSDSLSGREGGRLPFWGKVPCQEVDSHCDFYKTVTTRTQLLSSFFCRGQMQVFGKKWEEEMVGQTGGQRLLHSYSYYDTFVWTVFFI